MQQQPMNTTLNNTIMMEPPAIITVKDSLYINDMLSWNLLSMKKAHACAMQAQDPELKQHFQKCGEMHQRHYEKILSFLKPKQQTMQNNIQ